MKSFQQYLDEETPLAKIKAHTDSVCEELVEEFPFIEPPPPSIPFDGRTAIKSFTFI